MRAPISLWNRLYHQSNSYHTIILVKKHKFVDST